MHIHPLLQQQLVRCCFCSQVFVTLLSGKRNASSLVCVLSDAKSAVFVWGQISRGSESHCHEILHYERALSGMWFLPFWWQYFWGFSNRGPKMFFGQFVFDVASLACIINMAMPFVSGYCL